MFNKLINWFKNIRQNKQIEFEALAIPEHHVKADGSNKTKLFLIDASAPNFIIEKDVPKETMLGITVVGDQGPGFPLGSIPQQASACKIVINDALKYMSSKASKPIKRWTAVKNLTVMPRAGKDINAYYDRTSLKFFYFGVEGGPKNIFTCDCQGVVSHEFGHAFLDILRPDFWNTQASEIWAFHEAFGDITALLNAIQNDALIENALLETDGNMKKSNVITRMAPDMGNGVYRLTKGKDGELQDALRDLSIVFNYVQPEKLPTSGRDDQIINECHSFSRIFSGAFYQMLIAIAKDIQNKGTSVVQSIKMSGDICAEYFLAAVVQAPSTVRMFDAICQKMLLIDNSKGGTYQKIMMQVFQNQNLIIDKVLVLDDKNLHDFLKTLKEPYEIQNYEEHTVIRTLSNKTIKLGNYLGIMALADNPLLDLEIEVPNQTSYHFNENDKLVALFASDNTEIIDAAYTCLDILNTQNLVGNHPEALFEVNSGKLIRKQIVCRCKPNYCDPNAPEYGKPWKPKNNAGCSQCKSNCEPRPCDCNPTTPTPPPKLGCYTSVKTGGGKTYVVGSSASRRVC